MIAIIGLGLTIALFGSGIAAPVGPDRQAAAGANGKALMPIAWILTRDAGALLPAQAELRVLSVRMPRALSEPLDPDLTTAEFRPGESFSGNTVIKLSVAGIAHWLTARLELFVLAPVARRALSRGQTLTADDVALQKIARGLLRGSKAPDQDGWVGQRLSCDLNAGEALQAFMLQRPVVVSRGERVEIVVEGDGLRLQASGKALSAGRVGDTVSVQNDASGNKLQAEVVAPGQVRILLLAAQP